MELERYRALVCAIETGSLSAAAEKMQYTPSGISRMILALEEETGFPLLFRERNGVRPTRECQLLLPAIRELLYAGDNCTQVSAQIQGLEIGTVRIGTAYSAFYSPLASLISAFHTHHPGIQVQLSSGYSTELLARLSSHQIDLCIISERDGAHNWIPLLQDNLTAWLPASHRLAEKPAFPVTEFSKEPYIETYPDKDIDNAHVFSRCNVIPNLKFSTTDSLATYSMVEAGLGVSMNNAINGRAWSGNVRILPLDPPQIVEIGIASLPNLATAANQFLQFWLVGLPSFLQDF